MRGAEGHLIRRGALATQKTERRGCEAARPPGEERKPVKRTGKERKDPRKKFQ